MSMSTPPERRRMDGPIRRVAVPPIAPTSEPLSRTPMSDEATPARFATATASQPEMTAPVFEYRKPKRRRWVRKMFLSLGALVLLTGGWFGFKAISATSKIIAHSNGSAPALARSIDITKLKGEGDGRVNILMLGIGGAGHEAPNLSDTIMVMSIDPKTKDVAMLSIPRDLYVKIPASGKNKEHYGKINEVNSIGGPLLAKQVVQSIIGVPVHYYMVLDFSGFKQAIDAVGGVDIDVKQVLNDPRYPCDNNQYRECGYHQPVGHYHMNGSQALKYARCRKGNCGDDYGRAARQQEVIMALRQKALAASTLTNPIKLTGLIDSVGDHVKTDLQLGEIKKLALIAKDIDQTKMVSKVLTTDTDSYLMDGPESLGAGSVAVPKAGTFNYRDIQDFVKNIFADHYITDENARLEVQNGTGIMGAAGSVVASLKLAHYNVGQPANATGSYGTTVLYDYTNGKKPYTINYLEKRFNVKAQRMPVPSATPTPVTSPAATPAAAPEIRIILGSDYQRATSSN